MCTCSSPLVSTSAKSNGCSIQEAAVHRRSAPFTQAAPAIEPAIADASHLTMFYVVCAIQWHFNDAGEYITNKYFQGWKSSGQEQFLFSRNIFSGPPKVMNAFSSSFLKCASRCQYALLFIIHFKALWAVCS